MHARSQCARSRGFSMGPFPSSSGLFFSCRLWVPEARKGDCMTTLARRLSFCFLFSSVFGLVNLNAQVQATNGSIQGDVTDSAGAAVAGADVEADAVDTGTENKTVTDGSGHFGFPSLKPGRYQVKVSKTGFATTIQQNLTLTVGLTASLDRKSVV